MIRTGYATKNKTLSDTQDVHLCRSIPIHSVSSYGLDEGIKKLEELSLRNLADLQKVLQWNKENNVRVFVLPTGLFPYAADRYFGYSVKFASEELSTIGKFVKKNKQRLVFHIPPDIAAGLLSDQSHHGIIFLRFMNYVHTLITLLDLQKTVIVCSFSKVDERFATLDNLQSKLFSLPSHLRSYIALENDTFNFPISTLLPFCVVNDIPLVLNIHHEVVRLNVDFPPLHTIKAIERLWERLGKRCLMFYSEQLTSSGSMEERLCRKSHITRLPMIFEENVHNSDVIILSDSYEQSCRDFLPRTHPTSMSSSHVFYEEMRKARFKHGMKVLSDLP